MFDKLQFVVTARDIPINTGDKLKFVGQSLDRIVTTRAKRLTSQQAPNGHSSSPECSVTFDRFARIFGTGRSESAGWRQPRRDNCFVELQC